jgi:hypothetical protein
MFLVTLLKYSLTRRSCAYRSSAQIFRLTIVGLIVFALAVNNAIFAAGWEGGAGGELYLAAGNIPLQNPGFAPELWLGWRSHDDHFYRAYIDHFRPSTSVEVRLKKPQISTLWLEHGDAFRLFGRSICLATGIGLGELSSVDSGRTNKIGVLGFRAEVMTSFTLGNWVELESGLVYKGHPWSGSEWVDDRVGFVVRFCFHR